MRFGFVAFDLDGVLVDERSSWEWVHHYFGVDNREAYDLFMAGEIDDVEFMRRDVKLWREIDPDIDLARVDFILKAASLMKGCEEAVKAIKKTGVPIGIVSGGIDLLANHVADILGIEHVLANGLSSDETGRLTGDGVINVPLWDKGAALKRMLDGAGVDPADCAVVGNSCIDITMFELAGYSVAFKPIDEESCEAADAVVRSDDLRDILPHILD